MPSDRRLQRLNILLKELVSKILDRGFEFPENAMVTVTRVLVSLDGRYATVFLSVMGGADADKEALAIIKKNIYAIQQKVNRALSIRPVPQLRFAIDEGEAAREKIEKSLVELEQKKEL